MMDWDDVGYFLAVGRGGSVRAAAERLGVNHSTVLRRIAQLEERLGARMFEKLPSGYRLTDAGEEVLEVRGADGSVVEPDGDARLRARPERACRTWSSSRGLHPEIEMEILSYDEPVNLTNREADVAIRVGNPYDNAKAESFMKTLKQEKVNARRYRNLNQAQGAIGAFIETVYNRQRLHSALAYRSPDEYEATLARFPGVNVTA